MLSGSHGAGTQNREERFALGSGLFSGSEDVQGLNEILFINARHTVSEQELLPF